MLKIRSIVVLVFLSFNIALSQPCDGGPGCNGDSDTPITGIEILIALGGLFGVKKVFDSRKKNKPS